MEILVIGSERNLIECRQKFGEGLLYQRASSISHARSILGAVQVVFDFLIEPSWNRARVYHEFSGAVFLETSRVELKKLRYGYEGRAIFFGFCGLPTFLNRKVLEVCVHDLTDSAVLKAVCAKLNTAFVVVKDQVGMVTPRIIGMIINEAYFAVQENIAAREDIDRAMKLGTNYPFGPFEWATNIGLENVNELLKAVYEKTKDERYRVCALLEEEAAS